MRCRRFTFLALLLPAVTMLGACASVTAPAGRDGAASALAEIHLAHYLGKYVLVTMTFYDEDGDVVTQQQVHGFIVKSLSITEDSECESDRERKVAVDRLHDLFHRVCASRM